MTLISLKNILVVFCLATLVASTQAQNTTARFMLWQPSARSVAMGGVGTAVTDNSFAVFYNPAGLAFTSQVNFAGSYAKPFPFFDNTIHSLTALSLRFRGLGTFAISTNRFWRERQGITGETSPELIGFDGGKINFLKATHWEVKLSYATLLNENASVGVNVSILRMRLSETGPGAESGIGKTYTALFGAGFLLRNLLPNATWRPRLTHNSRTIRKLANRKEHAGLTLGFSILNAGPQIAFVDDSQKDQPPTLASLGLAYWPVSSPVLTLLISTDLEKEIFASSALDHIRFGNEIRLLDLFSLRTGYVWDTNKPSTSYFTFGGGVHLKYFSFNVARYERTLLPTWQVDGALSLEIW